jgi:hypothetical protein
MDPACCRNFTRLHRHSPCPLDVRMGSLSPTTRALLLLAALANFTGHVRIGDVITSTAELNRCLTAVRVALSRRGDVSPPPDRTGACDELRSTPSQRI